MVSNKNQLVIKILMLIIVIILCIGNNVNADTGPKPCIKIHLRNMDTTNYTIDLLTKIDEQSYMYNTIVEKYEHYKNTPIYKYSKDGWVATSLRVSNLWGDIEGNDSKTHSFTYLAVPHEFKIIIQYEDGTIKTSDIITRTQNDYNIFLDVNTMKITPAYEIDLFNIFECILITLIVEVLISLVMNIKHIKVIILTNFITQILIQSLRILNFNFLLSFIIAEILVFIIEYIVYRKTFKDIENRKILQYTFIANLTTAMLTFINNIPMFLLLFILFIIYSICNKEKLQYKLSTVILVIMATLEIIFFIWLAFMLLE